MKLRTRMLLLVITLTGYTEQVQARDLEYLQQRAEDRRMKYYRLWLLGHAASDQKPFQQMRYRRNSQYAQLRETESRISPRCDALSSTPKTNEGREQGRTALMFLQPGKKP